VDIFLRRGYKIPQGPEKGIWKKSGQAIFVAVFLITDKERGKQGAADFFLLRGGLGDTGGGHYPNQGKNLYKGQNRSMVQYGPLRQMEKNNITREDGG